MGQKVHPHGLRVGIIKDWDSKWYANDRDYSKFLIEDFKIREYIKKELSDAGISRVYIDRLANKAININIFTAKPGFIVGKDGEKIKTIKAGIERITKSPIKLDVSEVENINCDAQLVSEDIAKSLEKRISFRRAMKQAIRRTMSTNAKGIKVMVSGRLNGAEIARSERYAEGNVPLSTLRADIDYGFAEADTVYGKLGVKVWIYLGEVLPQISDETRLIRKIARATKPKNVKINNKRNGNRRSQNRNFKNNKRVQKAE